MGGAVSSGESNDDLIDNLLEADYIKSPLVERVFRAVDRAFYYTEAYKQNAYKDLAWKDGNLHLSAPCIYSEVLENLELGGGMSFLNIGSGTGYFSTMCGLILGKTGINHGIELYPDVVNYAKMKLEEFLRSSPAIDEFDFCPPEFTVGNCLDCIPAQKRYDRLYCGAACPPDYVNHLVAMLKIGGICVVPLGDSLVQIIRTEEKKDERKALLPVSFASLIGPKEGDSRVPVEFPDWSPKSLTELCRSEIRSALRQTIHFPEPKSATEENRTKKRRKRQERRRANRLVVVQRRRSGTDADGENGFVAIAYSMGSNSSIEERHQEENNASEDSSQEGNESPNNSTEENEADTIMEEAENDSDEEDAKPSTYESSSLSTNGSSTATASAPTRSTSNGKGNGVNVAVVNGSSPIVSTNGKTKTENGSRSELPERRAVSASAASGRGRQANGNGRPRSARSYTTGAEALLGRIREMVRARQHDLEVMRQQYQRNGRRNSSSEREESNGRQAGNEENANSPPAPAMHSDQSSSDSSPTASPSASATTSTSDDEGAGGNQNQADSKKRCRNESSDDEKGLKEPKPDPLLINPCSVQMRKKILELPLPPAIKTYLNFDRKLHY